MNLAQTHANDVNALKVIYNSLVLICKVFYSLNFQDLPEFFEDNMQIWMTNFHTLLTADVKCLQNTVSIFFFNPLKRLVNHVFISRLVKKLE